MAFTTQEHYDAEDYRDVFRASSFQNRLMDLLAVSDASNAKIIDENWGHIIRDMAEMYRGYKLRKVNE